MADITTGKTDEEIVRQVLRKGLNDAEQPKLVVLRLALALSLRLPRPPDEALDRIEDREGGSEYDLEQVTGLGRMKKDERGQPLDQTEALKAMLSVYHGRDLFSDGKEFRRLLQRHIRRGLREIRRSWRESHDFHEYLYQELFYSVPQSNEPNSDLEKALLEALRSIGIAGEIREQRQGPRLTRFFLHLPDVNHLDRLRKGLGKLAFSLGLNDQGIFPVPTDEPKVIGLDIPRDRGTWSAKNGLDLQGYVEKAPGGFVLPVWPGVDVLGEPFCFDLALAPHLLVGGSTGSGKSVCLHALLLSLLWRFTPEQLKLCLIDPKKVEFVSYNNLPHLFHERIITDAGEATEALYGVVDEMERRTSLLAEAGVRDLIEGRAKGSIREPFLVVFVEELSDLFSQSRAAEEALVWLAQKARATGIHLVLSTQRPDAETFSGLLRSNIPSRIALTVQKATESKIILDENGAEALTGRGDMLVKLTGERLRRLHGILILPDDIAACVRSAGGGRG